MLKLKKKINLGSTYDRYLDLVLKCIKSLNPYEFLKIVEVN